MRLALLRLATTAWADHGGPLRAEGLSPLTVGLLAGALALAAGVLIAVSYTTSPSPRDMRRSRMPSSA
jgi:hypothetical protein